MEEKACALLQSGFLALPGTVLSKPQNSSNAALISALKTGKLDQATTNPYFYSQEITELFQEYLTNSNSLSRFEFREKVLCLAFKLLSPGRQTFQAWVNLQVKSPNVTNLHRKFIKDTLDYLTNYGAGTSGRSVEMESWQSLLVASAANRLEIKSDFDTSRYFTTSPSQSSSFINLMPIPMEEVLARWCQKSRGFRDLLMFLYIVYGKRQMTRGGYAA